MDSDFVLRCRRKEIHLFLSRISAAATGLFRPQKIILFSTAKKNSHSRSLPTRCSLTRAICCAFSNRAPVIRCSGIIIGSAVRKQRGCLSIRTSASPRSARPRGLCRLLISLTFLKRLWGLRPRSIGVFMFQILLSSRMEAADIPALTIVADSLSLRD